MNGVSCALTEADASLVASFERGTLPPHEFRHREHLHLAWCYLRGRPFEEAAARFETSLIAYAERHGGAAKIDLPLTWAYLGLVKEALRVEDRSFGELLERRPDLLARRLSRA